MRSFNDLVVGSHEVLVVLTPQEVNLAITKFIVESGYHNVNRVQLDQEGGALVVVAKGLAEAKDDRPR